MTRAKQPSPPMQRCGRGTHNGAAAEASRFGFCPCILPFDHARIGPGCDSGPVVDDEPKQAA